METDIPGKQNTIRSASFDDVHVETACLLETQQDPAQYLYILGDDETPSTISRKDRKPTAAAVAASSSRVPKKAALTDGNASGDSGIIAILKRDGIDTRILPPVAASSTQSKILQSYQRYSILMHRPADSSFCSISGKTPNWLQLLERNHPCLV